MASDDPYVDFARSVVESYVEEGELPLLEEAPEELRESRAGAFVTLKKGGDLRGCIGTVRPVAKSVAEEIRNNAVSSATGDPRFPPIAPDELPELEYSVDILGEPQPVSGIEELDPKRYGVIVRSGSRSGLLLPDLEGIDTAEEQLRIAMMKAGIRPSEPVILERFEVIRHE
jgi:MEMO1 family protein